MSAQPVLPNHEHGRANATCSKPLRLEICGRRSCACTGGQWGAFASLGWPKSPGDVLVMFLGCPIGLSRHLSINCEHLVVLNRVCFMCFAVSKSDYQRLPNSINGIHSSGCFGLACQDCLFRTSRFGFKHIDCPSVVKLGLSEKKMSKLGL